MPTVSVIIPAYGHAHFLKQTISSVLQQSWSDYEIIVVDDGSPDETPAVVAEFGPAVHYFRQPNRGMAATRNAAISHASGELICFLDDDDVWLPNYLSTVVEHFQADPHLAALHTGFQLTSDQPGQDFPNEGTRTVSPEDLYNTLLEAGFFPPSSVSVRRTCLDTVGLFDEHLQGYADWELWLRICREHKFTGISDVLVKYRLHAGGLSSNIQHMSEDRMRALHKHFGPPDGDAATWPEAKRRAYAFAYRFAAFEYSIRGRFDEAWQFMKQAAPIWPAILARLDTFYELACGDQPRGIRGQADALDIERNGTDLLRRLDQLFAEREPAVQRQRRSAYGNAYLALGMLSDQAGRWPLARKYLWRAAQANPALFGSLSFNRRVAKLLLGARAQAIRQHVANHD